LRIDLSRVAASAIDAALDDGKPQRGRLTGPKAIAAGAALALAARYAVAKAPHIPRIPGLSDLSSLPDRLRDHLPDDLHDMLADRGWLGDTDGARVDEEGFDLTDDDESDEGDEGGEPPDDEDDGGGPEAGEDLFADEPEDSEEPEAEDEEPEADEDEEPEDEEDEPEEGDEPEEDEAEPDEPEGEPRDLFADEPDEDEEPEEDASEDVPRDLFVDEPDAAAPDADSDGNLAADVPSVMDVLSRIHPPRPLLANRRPPRRRPRVDPAERPPEPPKRTSDDKSRKAKARKR
jgi:hypothetical protein